MLFQQPWRTFVWALFILLLTGIPGTYLPGIVSFWDWFSPDKLVHLFMFGILAYVALYDVQAQYLQSKRRYIYVIAAVSGAALYGAITEILQRYLFTGRSGNMYDALADALGAMLGAMLFIWMRRKKNMEEQQTDN